jgi:hypothetical protein
VTRTTRCLGRGSHSQPPGFMKSLLVNVFWPAWEWGPCDLPHMRYILFSYSDEITTRDNNKMAMLIQSPGYRQLWGDRFIMSKTGERRLVNDKTGFKLATSVGGVSTGERGDRVLLDHPHNVAGERVLACLGVGSMQSAPHALHLVLVL